MFGLFVYLFIYLFYLFFHLFLFVDSLQLRFRRWILDWYVWFIYLFIYLSFF